jgi:hypothetical protein
LFAIAKIPSDNHIRDLLNPAEPALLDPVFAETLAALERRAGGLARFRRLGDHVLIALDGTEYFCSKTIYCHPWGSARSSARTSSLLAAPAMPKWLRKRRGGTSLTFKQLPSLSSPAYS